MTRYLNHEDMHAGELETSILPHANPELARDGYQAADWVANDRRHLLTTGMGGVHAKRSDRPTVAGFGGEGQGITSAPVVITGRSSRR